MWGEENGWIGVVRREQVNKEERESKERGKVEESVEARGWLEGVSEMKGVGAGGGGEGTGYWLVKKIYC